MKEQFILISLAIFGLIVVLATGAIAHGGSTTAISTLCDPDKYSFIERKLSIQGVIISELVICPVSGIITTIHSPNGATVDEQRPSTTNEQQLYSWELAANEFDLSNARLKSDIEFGQNWVKTLRAWSVDYQNTADNWDSFSVAEKLQRIEIKIRRDAMLMNGLADLLVTLGY